MYFIILSIQKAGFMQLEIAFANELDELRSIVIYVRSIEFLTVIIFFHRNTWMLVQVLLDFS